MLSQNIGDVEVENALFATDGADLDSEVIHLALDELVSHRKGHLELAGASGGVGMLLEKLGIGKLDVLSLAISLSVEGARGHLEAEHLFKRNVHNKPAIPTR